MREPQFDWANSCMVYDPIQQTDERIHNDGSVTDTYNTCLMVTKREDQIFTKWWDKLVKLDAHYKASKEYYDARYTNLDYRKLEELSFDLLSLDVKIHNIPNSIFGETYTPIADMTQDELDHVWFHHYHIYPQLSRYNWLRDIREWNNRLQ
mgnify:CR=1 FL=1